MDLTKLNGHVPDAVRQELNDVLEKFGINTPLRMAHFLSQCAHESGNFTRVQAENLNYSANRLLEVFPKYFDATTAAQYAMKPDKIASRVYASRMGNGNEASGDGYFFCGRGFIQLTGKQNYILFDDFVPENIVKTPILVRTQYPLLSAAWFWSRNGINAIADLGSDMAVITKVTKKVNGGTIGLEDRAKHFNEFYNLIK